MTLFEICWQCRGVGTACFECDDPRCDGATACPTCDGDKRVPAGTSMRDNSEPPPKVSESADA